MNVLEEDSDRNEDDPEETPLAYVRADWSSSPSSSSRSLTDGCYQPRLNLSSLALFGMFPMAEPLPLVRCAICSRPYLLTHAAFHESRCRPGNQPPKQQTSTSLAGVAARRRVRASTPDSVSSTKSQNTSQPTTKAKRSRLAPAEPRILVVEPHTSPTTTSAASPGPSPAVSSAANKPTLLVPTPLRLAAQNSGGGNPRPSLADFPRRSPFSLQPKLIPPTITYRSPATVTSASAFVPSLPTQSSSVSSSPSTTAAISPNPSTVAASSVANNSAAASTPTFLPPSSSRNSTTSAQPAKQAPSPVLLSRTLLSNPWLARGGLRLDTSTRYIHGQRRPWPTKLSDGSPARTQSVLNLDLDKSSTDSMPPVCPSPVRAQQKLVASPNAKLHAVPHANNGQSTELPTSSSSQPLVSQQSQPTMPIKAATSDQAVSAGRNTRHAAAESDGNQELSSSNLPALIWPDTLRSDAATCKTDEAIDHSLLPGPTLRRNTRNTWNANSSTARTTRSQKLAASRQPKH